MAIIKDKIVKILLIPLSLVIFCAVVEIVLRISGFDYGKQVSEAIANHERIDKAAAWALDQNCFANPVVRRISPDIYVTDKIIFWKLKANNEFSSNNIVYKINSSSMRSPEAEYVKNQKNVCRILYLGDSCTFGWGVDYEDTFANVLNELLSKHYINYRFESINSGVPGYSSFQGLRYYQSELYKYNPDIVIAFFGANDVVLSLKPDKYQSVASRAQLQLDEFLMLHNKLYGFLKLIILNSYIMRCRFVQRVSYADFTDNLRDLKNAAGYKGAKIIFMFPIWRDADALIHNPWLSSTPSVDIYSIFTAKINGMHYRARDLIYDGVHPSALGHRIIAETISDKIIDDKMIQ